LGTQIRVAIIATKGTKKTKRSDVEAILEAESDSRGFLGKLGDWFLGKLGDWLVLYFVTRNLNALVVNDLITELHKEEASKNFNSETLKLKPESSAV